MRIQLAAGFALLIATSIAHSAPKPRFASLPADVQQRITAALSAHSREELVRMIEDDANAAQLIALIAATAKPEAPAAH